MATATDECCYIGRGRIYVRPYVCETPGVVNTNAKIFIGNTSNFQVNVSQNRLTQTDYSGLGGTECTATFIEDVTVSIDVACFRPENLAFAFFGESSSAAAGTGFVQTETVPSTTDGAFIFLDNLPDTATTPIVVTDGAGTTYTLGTDYRVGNAGIELLSGTSIPAGSQLEITYDFIACNVTEMLTTGGSEVEICFDGINAVSQRPFTVRLYRVALDPTSSLGFISDDFQSITLTGTVNRDDGRSSGTVFSQFGMIKQAG